MPGLCCGEGLTGGFMSTAFGLTELAPSVDEAVRECEHQSTAYRELLSDSGISSPQELDRLSRQFEDCCAESRIGFAACFQKWMDRGSSPDLLRQTGAVVRSVRELIESLDRSDVRPLLDRPRNAEYLFSMQTRVEVLSTAIQSGIDAACLQMQARLERLIDRLCRAGDPQLARIQWLSWDECLSEPTQVPAQVSDEERAMWVFAAYRWLAMNCLYLASDLLSESGPWAKSLEAHAGIAEYVSDRAAYLKRHVLDAIHWPETSSAEVRALVRDIDGFTRRTQVISARLHELNRALGTAAEQSADAEHVCEVAIRKEGRKALRCYSKVVGHWRRLSCYVSYPRRSFAYRPLTALVDLFRSAVAKTDFVDQSWSDIAPQFPSDELVAMVAELMKTRLQQDRDRYAKCRELEPDDLGGWGREVQVDDVKRALLCALDNACAEIVSPGGVGVLAEDGRFTDVARSLMADDLGMPDRHVDRILGRLGMELIACLQRGECRRPWGVASLEGAGRVNVAPPPV